MLVADVGYDVLVLHDMYTPGGPIDAGWLVSYALFGIAAVHPSMNTVAPGRVRSGPRPVRLPLIAPAGFITPLILVAAGLFGLPIDLPVLGAISIVLYSPW